MVKLYLLLAAIIVLSSEARAQQSKSDLERQRAAIQREIDDVRQSLNETKKNKKETLGQLSLIQKRMKLRQSEIDNINQQIGLIQSDITQSGRDIDKLKKELDTLKSQYAKSVLYAYKNRSNYDFLNFIFSASNFNDALKRVAYLRSYRNYREQQAANIRNTYVLIEQKLSVLNENKEKNRLCLLNKTNSGRCSKERRKKRTR